MQYLQIVLGKDKSHSGSTYPVGRGQIRRISQRHINDGPHKVHTGAQSHQIAADKVAAHTAAVQRAVSLASAGPRLLDMTLLEIGIPLAHIVEIDFEDEEKLPLFLELTADLPEVLPALCSG